MARKSVKHIITEVVPDLICRQHQDVGSSNAPQSTEALLARIRELEGKLQEASTCPRSPIVYLIGFLQRRPGGELSKTMSASSPASYGSMASPSMGADAHADSSSNEESSDEDPTEPLAEWIEKLQIDPLYPRQIIGPWSGKKLVTSAMEIKHQVTGLTSQPSVVRRPEFWRINPVGL
jgi:hypothetical protein